MIFCKWSRWVIAYAKAGRNAVKGSKKNVPVLPKGSRKNVPLLLLPPASYQIARTCCKARLVTIMATQQQKPKTIGFPPVFTSFIIFVFKPIAAMARMIKNLLSSLNGINTDEGTPKPVAIVVTTDANTK